MPQCHGACTGLRVEACEEESDRGDLAGIMVWRSYASVLAVTSKLKRIDDILVVSSSGTVITAKTGVSSIGGAIPLFRVDGRNNP